MQAVFRKGAHAAAYAGFEGSTTARRTGRSASRTGCASRAIEQVDVVGIATDHCVRATALDAAAEGFETTVLLDLTAGVARETTDRALAQLREAGVELAASRSSAAAGVALTRRASPRPGDGVG